MLKARIYKPSKTAMQSGRGREDLWVLEYESEAGRVPEPLMGWSSAGDTLGQVRLSFAALEDARKFALEHGMSFSVMPSHQRKQRPRNYGDNFRYIPAEEKVQKSS